MDIKKLEKMIEIVGINLSKYSASSSLLYHDERRAEVANLMSFAIRALPEHKAFFASIKNSIYGLRVHEVYEAIDHIKALLKIEKESEMKIKELKVFEGASDKLKKANLSFRKEDYTSAFHNLNTALELVLKDKLGIPTTLTKINTSNIIDILVKHKVEPYLYLVEARKHVLLIDNKIKHIGYSPSKIECINGIKAMEELISKLRGKEVKLTEEIRNKIYQGL